MTQPAARRWHLVHGRWPRLLALSAVVGCGHSEPFASRDFSTDDPFDPSPPVQITLNHGHDRRAAWLPDGSAILYSTQLEGTRDGDVCLAVLPPTGGRQRALTCTLSPDGDNLREALESPAPASDGRLAFVAATGQRGGVFPERQELSLASISDPVTRAGLLGMPYTIPGRRTHGGISQIHWLSSSRLLYLGEMVNVYTPCSGCMRDTMRSGLDAVWLDVTASGSTPQPIPGTDNASGVSPGTAEDEIYYTLGGDTRVYHQVLSSGVVSVIYDFGAAGVARDVDVVGGRMAAVVGGRVHFVDDPSFGPTQWDSGGIVHVVNLADGADVTLTNPNEPGLYRRPRISPTGSQIVVERYPVVIFETDTVVLRTGDLFLLGQP